ncbi:hypothetical protein [Clostridium sp.]|uniref:hypothetical protein n=1 Tax=Clostridium sp. TaxID=1506 RepID=UPI0025C3ABE3|nr:hypothetical protein [Clostridium sp.]
MWSEKRGIESYLFFAILPIVINLATNVLYFISEGSYETLKAVNEFNSFTLFCILICCVFNFFERCRKLSEYEKKELNKKMYAMKILNIFFIGYIIFTIIIVKNISIIISALIMYVGYINLYMFKSKIRTVAILSATQRNWRKAYNKHFYEDSSLLWKIKPMLVPHVSVSFTERIKHINWLGLIFILPFLGDFRLVYIPMMVITFIFIISDTLYFVDAILGLYTETEGICTGIVMKVGSRGKRRYYEVYVTDFPNKREIKFRVYDYCNYNEYDVVKLTHGGLSKKVIETKIVSKYFM